MTERVAGDTILCQQSVYKFEWAAIRAAVDQRMTVVSV
jgi:hypothetical protein